MTDSKDVLNGEVESVVVDAVAVDTLTEDNTEFDTVSGVVRDSDGSVYDSKPSMQQSSKDQYTEEEILALDPNEVLADNAKVCDEILNQGFENTKEFAKSADLKVMGDDAAILMNSAMEDIEGIQQKNSMLVNLGTKLVPASLQKHLRIASAKMKEEEIKQTNIKEITDKLFTGLDDRKLELLAVADEFCDILDSVSITIDSLNVSASDLQNKINILEAGKKLNSSQSMRLHMQLNKITSNIQHFNNQYEDIQKAQFAAQTYIQQIDTEIPSLRGQLLNGMAISNFLTQIGKFSQATNSVFAKVHEVNLSNSKNVNSVLEDVTDLSKNQELSNKMLELNNIDRDKTNVAIQKNMTKNFESVEKGRLLLRASSDKRKELPAFMQSKEAKELFNPEEINSDNLLDDQSRS
jgi:hypothetical protein